MKMSVEMALFEQEYKLLLKAKKLSNYENKYIETDLKDTTHDTLDSNSFYYDNTISVDISMLPFVAIVGNSEYQALMRMLDYSVLKNDGYDEIYIKDFIKKE